jgi:hypothetical protein
MAPAHPPFREDCNGEPQRKRTLDEREHAESGGEDQAEQHEDQRDRRIL